MKHHQLLILRIFYKNIKGAIFFLSVVVFYAPAILVAGEWTRNLSNAHPGSLLIDGGEYHGMIIINGECWAWGNNSSGQLGDNSSVNRSTPVKTVNQSGFTEVEGGYAFTLALKSNGTVWSWGDNYEGCLGNGNPGLESYVPVPVTGSANAIAVSASGYHGLYLKADGTVRAWGYNPAGEIGDGTTSNRSTPVSVSGLTDVVAISAGSSHNYALKADGTVWGWGGNGAGQIGDGTTSSPRLTAVQVSGLSSVIKISAGYNAGYALKADGTVWAWGLGDNGQLGNGATTNQYTPVQVTGMSSVITVQAQKGFYLFGSGGHALALKADGTVWAWGKNDRGQIGDGTVSTRLTPVQTSGLSNIAAIGAARMNGYAIKSDGTIWSWGEGLFGMIGDGANSTRYTPVQLSSPLLTDFVAIAGGRNQHSLALKGNGTIRAWGKNNPYGEIGDGTTVDQYNAVNVTGISNVIAISANNETSYGLRADGTLWSWGWNTWGELGDGSTTTARYSPTQVSTITNVKAIEGGEGHTLAVKADGTVWAWGYNAWGQLGDGTTLISFVPLQVSGLSNIVDVAAGGDFSAALRADGTVWTWGRNADGQIGDNTNITRATPVQVQDGAASYLEFVSNISAARFSVRARLADGTIWSWGDNNYGTLGIGNTTDKDIATNSGFTLASAVGKGPTWQSIILKSDGTVWGSGYNAYGQLGDGTTSLRDDDVQATGVSNVVGVAAGQEHGLIRKDNWTICTVGSNVFGQLGDGTTDNASVYTCVNALGIQFQYFRAALTHENKVLLEWLPGTEENLNYFIAEKSANGKDFQEVKKIFASTGNLSHAYSAVDPSPDKGINFYRISTADNPGNISYSDIREIFIGQPDDFSILFIYPNPTKYSLTVAYELPERSNTELALSVSNIFGQRLIKKTLIGKPSGIHREEIDVSSLSRGVYLVKLQSGESTKTKKFQIER